ncbi:MAG TPA: 3-dehydroquinate synthase [Candidatus Ozemobacteraceae bacterium]|nr:3-dehydroquinate synthase [Candidatus Ozemobacteraceae bacterium]
METQRLVFKRHSTNEIILGNDIVKETVSRLLRFRVARHCAIITNETIARWYLAPLASELRSRGFSVHEIIVPDGEKFKTFDTALDIIKSLSASGIDRDCPLIGLGGGVVCDLTGYVASIYKRGLPLVLVPTSLLAMVDASIGGKNGVNLEQGKNLAGTFYQPLLTAIDVAVLRTLPLNQLSYGLVEAVKHGAIADSAYFRFIFKHMSEIKSKQLPLMQRLIRRSIHIKKSFVATDELDTSLRNHLNLGHTFGHALEGAGNFIRLHHGEAVGLGMLMAIKASTSNGILEEDYSEALRAILTEFNLPTKIPNELEKKEILNNLAQDKKKSQTGYQFILPVTLGKTMIHKVEPEKIDDFFTSAMNI